jgi:glyoxylase-like metal-dependent hydrolase (beta-lactamase superfamily II)
MVNRREWEYWSSVPTTDPRWHPCLEDSVWPLEQAEAIHWMEAGQCVEGIRVHEAAGHTPGNVIFEIDGQNLWFLGDLLHHPAQIAHPEWPSAAFDVDAELNTRQRRRYFKHFADSGAALFAAHMGNQFGVKETHSGQFCARYD